MTKDIKKKAEEIKAAEEAERKRYREFCYKKVRQHFRNPILKFPIEAPFFSRIYARFIAESTRIVEPTCMNF